MDLDNILDSFENEEKKTVYRENVGDEKIVFIHDSYRKKYGKTYSFDDKEYGILSTLLGKTNIPDGSYQFVPAIGGYDMREDDITTEILHIHREKLIEDLEAIGPDLIIPLGNLSFKTLTKKSGVSFKRGREFFVELDGEATPVVPTLHPFSLYSEPKLRRLFVQDAINAYDKFVLGINRFDSSPYELVTEVGRFEELIDECLTKEAVAIDLETNGLDYKLGKILTIGFSFGEKQGFVLPIYHFESQFIDTDIDRIRNCIQDLISDESVVKIFHNSKFDVKFLLNWGIKDFNNIEDTQVMHSLVDENLPHSLMDLVKQYFPHELEKF